MTEYFESDIAFFFFLAKSLCDFDELFALKVRSCLAQGRSIGASNSE